MIIELLMNQATKYMNRKIYLYHTAVGMTVFHGLSTLFTTRQLNFNQVCA